MSAPSDHPAGNVSTKILLISEYMCGQRPSGKSKRNFLGKADESISSDHVYSGAKLYSGIIGFFDAGKSERP